MLVVQVESTASLPELPVVVSVCDCRAKSYERIGVSVGVEKLIGPKATSSETDILLSTVGVNARRATALAVRLKAVSSSAVA